MKGSNPIHREVYVSVGERTLVWLWRFRGLADCCGAVLIDGGTPPNAPFLSYDESVQRN